jgi:copper chaperone
MTHAKLKIEGMSCGHSVRAVDGAVKGVAGVEVKELQVGSVVVAYDPAAIRLEQIERAIEEEGYTVVSRAEEVS